MRPHDTNPPERSRTVEKLRTVRETPALDDAEPWQELKGRITALRRALHKMPVSLIGSSCWANRIQELEECQRRLALLSAPPSLQPQPIKLVLSRRSTLRLDENGPTQSGESLKPFKIKLSMTSR
jgi:hypothetical protein